MSKLGKSTEDTSSAVSSTASSTSSVLSRMADATCSFKDGTSSSSAIPDGFTTVPATAPVLAVEVGWNVEVSSSSPPLRRANRKPSKPNNTAPPATQGRIDDFFSVGCSAAGASSTTAGVAGCSSAIGASACCCACSAAACC